MLAAQQDGVAGARLWIGRHAEVEEYLREAEILSMEEVGYGSTNPSRAELAPGGPVARMAWKPIPTGRSQGHYQSYKYEIAAYELDKLLGLNLVPPTVERAVAGKKGAAIMWMEGVTNFRDLGGLPQAPPEKQSMWNRQIARAKMFHNLVGNSDPNLGNWLVDSEWNLFLIDHSRAFGRSKNPVHKIGRFDRELFSKMSALDSKALEEGAGAWLTEKERARVIDRLERMKAEVAARVERLAEERVFLPPDG